MAPLGAKCAKGAPGPPPASKTGVILRDQLTLAALGGEDAEFALFRTFCGISPNHWNSWVFLLLAPKAWNVAVAPRIL